MRVIARPSRYIEDTCWKCKWVYELEEGDLYKSHYSKHYNWKCENTRCGAANQLDELEWKDRNAKEPRDEDSAARVF